MSAYYNTDPEYEDSPDPYDDFDFEEEDPPCSNCGRPTVHEFCGQCGFPLCPMCFEVGGGFCTEHPDANYQPYEPEA